jgi:hypothetical protein
MNNVNQTDHDAFEESFVSHGKKFYDVNCKVDDEHADLCPFVVYEKDTRFRNVDPKEFEHVMNEGCQNSKHTKTWAKKAFWDFQKHHGSLVELNITNMSKHKYVTSFMDMLALFKL